jgi:hypothetical protein
MLDQQAIFFIIHWVTSTPTLFEEIFMVGIEEALAR